jgi:hypothetical protein
MQEVTLRKDDLVEIMRFMDKYPHVNYVDITVDSSSGIGSIIKANISTELNGDEVTISKTIVDESSW